MLYTSGNIIWVYATFFHIKCLHHNLRCCVVLYLLIWMILCWFIVLSHWVQFCSHEFFCATSHFYQYFSTVSLCFSGLPRPPHLFSIRISLSCSHLPHQIHLTIPSVYSPFEHFLAFMPCPVLLETPLCLHVIRVFVGFNATTTLCFSFII